MNFLNLCDQITFPFLILFQDKMLIDCCVQQGLLIHENKCYWLKCGKKSDKEAAFINVQPSMRKHQNHTLAFVLTLLFAEYMQCSRSMSFQLVWYSIGVYESQGCMIYLLSFQRDNQGGPKLEINGNAFLYFYSYLFTLFVLQSLICRSRQHYSIPIYQRWKYLSQQRGKL